jgi:hypothetical protein
MFEGHDMFVIIYHIFLCDNHISFRTTTDPKNLIPRKD